MGRPWLTDQESRHDSERSLACAAAESDSQTATGRGARFALCLAGLEEPEPTALETPNDCSSPCYSLQGFDGAPGCIERRTICLSGENWPRPVGRGPASRLLRKSLHSLDEAIEPLLVPSTKRGLSNPVRTCV